MALDESQNNNAVLLSRHLTAANDVVSVHSSGAQMSNMLFEPIALNDVLVEPLLQILSGEVIVAGACSMVLGVRSVWQ